MYTWNSTVTLNGSRVVFFADQPAGSNIGVAPPSSWRIEYLSGSGSWSAVENSTMYPLAVTDSPAEVGFVTVATTSIRLLLTASGKNNQFSGVGVKEWEALAPTAR